MTSQRGGAVDRVLLLLLVASVGANVWLGLKLRQCSLRPAAPPTLTVGDRFPIERLSAVGMLPGAGQDPSGQTVYYVYSPSCAWCRRNAPSVDLLARRLAGRLRVVGICLGTSTICPDQSQTSPFTIRTTLDPSAARTVGLAGVPATIVVSGKGIVEQVFPGAYAGPTRKALQQYFNVELPELALATGDGGPQAP